MIREIYRAIVSKKVKGLVAETRTLPDTACIEDRLNETERGNLEGGGRVNLLVVIVNSRKGRYYTVTDKEMKPGEAIELTTARMFGHRMDAMFRDKVEHSKEESGYREIYFRLQHYMWQRATLR